MSEQLQPGKRVDITIRRALIVGETPATPEDVRVIVFGHDAIAEAVHLAVTDDVTIGPCTPVGWPPRPGDLWKLDDGTLWFGTLRGPDTILVNLYDEDLEPSAWAKICQRFTLVHHELRDGGDEK